MRKAFSIFLLLLLILCNIAFSQSTEKSLYQLKIEKGNIRKENGKTYLTIPATLTNFSADTLKYLDMSYSWQSIYRVDNDKIEFESWGCDKNIVTVLELGPNQNKTVNLKLSINQQQDLVLLNLKLE